MKDDADLRARIEAHVAARRAKAAADPPNAASASPASAYGSEPPVNGAASSATCAEPAAEPAAGSSVERPHPRPRPGPGTHRPRPPASSEQVSLGKSRNDAAGDPDNASPQPAPADSGDSSDSAEDSVKSPDISRFLAASEPEAEDRKPSRASRSTRKAARIVLRIALVVGIALGAAILLRTYVVAPYYIPSASMEPTLHGCTGCDDDHVLVDKISYRLHAPQESDIVVFSKPPNAQTQDKVLIKRVIGLPGDRLALEHGHVYINGRRIQEPYVSKACGPHPTQPEDGQSRWKVPKGDIFVMGDNRCDSMDSRTFGPIPESSVIGRAFAIIWPLGRIGLL